MALGKQVADAYIEVHGDLNPFRRDLEGIDGDAEEAGQSAGDEFAQAFENIARKELNSRWDSVTQALYSGKGIDWDKAFGSFDSSTLSEAHDKVTEFFQDMENLGAMNEEQWAQAQTALNKVLLLRKEEFDQTRLNVASVDSQREAMDRLVMKTFEATDAQKRFNSSFEGMFTANKIAEMERDFKALTVAMSDLDFSKMAKGQQDLDTWKIRMDSVVESMRRMGRVSDENAVNINRSLQEFVGSEGLRREAVRGTNEEMAKAKQTFDGLAASVKSAALHRDFQLIAEGVATNNWAKFAANHKTLDSMKQRLTLVQEEMTRLGNLTDLEADRINAAFGRMARNQRDSGVEVERSAGLMKALEFAVNRVQIAWSRTDSTVRVVTALIAAAAGPVAALASGLAGAGTALVSSLAMAAGSFIPLIAGAGALGVGILLAVQSFDQVVAAIPRVQQSLDSLGASFGQQATLFAAAWGPALDNLLNNFAARMANQTWGTQFGQAFAAITDGFNGVLNSPGFSALLDAMSTTLPAAAQGLGVGFAGLFQGLVSLMAAAAPIAQALGEDFARWGTALGEAAERGRASGELQAIFERMRESLLAVLDLAGSIGNALGTLFMLGSTSGNSMLVSLTGIVDKFNEWMQSEGGRATMLAWFSQAEAIVRSLEPLAVGLGRALAGLVTPTSVGQVMELSTQLGNFLPKLSEILQTVSQLGILNIFVDALSAIGTAITPLLSPIAEMNAALGPSLQGVLRALGPLFAGVAAALAPWIAGMAEVVSVIGPQLGPAIERVTAALSPLLDIIGQVVQFMSGLLVPVITFVAELLLNALTGAVEGVSQVLTGFVDLVTSLFQGDFAGAFSALVDIVTGALTAVWNIVQLMVVGRILSILRTGLAQVPTLFRAGFTALQGIVSSAFAAIPGIVSAGITIVAGLFATFGEAIGTALSSGLSAMGAGITAAFNATVSFLQTAWQAVVDFFTGSFTNVGTGASAAFASIGTASAAAVTWLQTAWSGVVEFFNSILTNIQLAWANLPLFFSTLWAGTVAALQGAWAGVQAFFATIVTGIQAAWTGLGAFFSTLWAATVATIQSEWASVTAFFGTVVAGIQAIWAPIGAFFSTVWNGIVTTVTTVMTTILTAVQTGWATVTSVFQTAVTAVTAAVTAGFALLGSIFDGLFAIWNVAVSAGWMVIQTLFTAAWETIKTIVAAGILILQAIFTGNFDQIGVIIQAAWTRFQAIISSTLTTIQAIITAAWAAIQQGVSAVWGLITQAISMAWTAITTTVQTAISSVVTGIQTGWNNAVTFTQTLWSNIVTFLQTAWSNIVTAVQTGISNAITGIQNGWNNAVTFTQNAWNNIVTAIQTAWNSTVSAVQNGISNAITSIQNGWNNAVQATQTAWNNVVTAIRTAWSNTVSAVQNGISDALSAIQNGWNNAVSATRNAWNNLVSAIRTAWSNTVSAVQNGISDALNAIRTGWNNAVSATQTAWNNMVNGIQTAMSNLRNAVSNGINDAVAFFTGLPGRISDALSGAASTLTTIGTQMIQGLINGIKDMAQSAVNAVGDVVGGAIAWAENLLNLGSPSKLFRQFGQWTGEGFALGTLDEVDRVRNATEKMIEGATGTIDPDAMYLQGRDAALGLADGLSSGSSSLAAALGDLTAEVGVSAGRNIAPISSFAPVATAQSAGVSRQVVFEEGAVQLRSNASDEEILANKVADRMSERFGDFSQV